MPNDATIREGTVDDARAVAEFQTATWNEVYEGIVSAEYNSGTTVEKRAARWAQRLAGERAVLVAEHEGRVVAVASAGERRDDRGGADLELMSIYLAPDVRGTGLADQLVEQLLADAPAVLWVFEGNERAIGFYRRHGFEPDGEGMFDVDTGVPEIRMARSSVGT